LSNHPEVQGSKVKFPLIITTKKEMRYKNRPIHETYYLDGNQEKSNDLSYRLDCQDFVGHFILFRLNIVKRRAADSNYNPY
jgi:hypothetical protein